MAFQEVGINMAATDMKSVIGSTWVQGQGGGKASWGLAWGREGTSVLPLSSPFLPQNSHPHFLTSYLTLTPPSTHGIRPVPWVLPEPRVALLSMPRVTLLEDIYSESSAVWCMYGNEWICQGKNEDFGAIVFFKHQRESTYKLAAKGSLLISLQPIFQNRGPQLLQGKSLRENQATQ